MSSSGGGDGGLSSLLAMQAAQPIAGLPVAGSSGANIDPYSYGQFQNFLPDAKAEGSNDVATGLRPDMFKYTKPNPGGGTVGNTLGGGDAAAAPAAAGGGADPRSQLAATMAGGGAAPAGTMGLGGGGGPFANGLAPPPGAQQLPTPPGGWVTPYPVQVNTNSGFPTDWRSRG
jgi:hypothetical protein